MKKIAIVLSTFCLTLIFGQKVSDYKYVSVPEVFQSFKKGDYGMGNLLVKSLKGKKFIVLPVDKQEWPAEVKQNQCNLLTADILNDSSFLKNKIILQFKDCNDKVILESKGSSNIKDFVEGYAEALQKSLVSVPVSNPVATVVENNQMSTQVTAEVKEAVTVTDNVQKAVKYSNGKLDLQKIQIDSNQFILADMNSSVPFATFRQTTKKDVFRVKLSNGEWTIGYFEGDNLVVEIPQSNGEFSKEIFSTK